MEVCVVLMLEGLGTTAIPVTAKGADATPTLTEAVPDLVPSCVEVAVQVPVPVLDGVNTPACVMEPPVADQVTPVLIFPLPDTVAVQVDVCPRRMEAGIATTETELTWLP